MIKKIKVKTNPELALYGLDPSQRPSTGSVFREKCKHKPLPLGDFVVEGGSCIHPPSGFTHYIGLDSAMAAGMVYPWDGGVEVCMPIQNYAAPKDPEEFKKLVDWACTQVQKPGVKMHVGCMAGHGRTGLLLAAMASRFGHHDAIRYVRENYCSRAVESATQVGFLVKHFGIKPAKPRDEPVTPSYRAPTVSYSTSAPRLNHNPSKVPLSFDHKWPEFDPDAEADAAAHALLEKYRAKGLDKTGK